MIFLFSKSKEVYLSFIIAKLVIKHCHLTNPRLHPFRPFAFHLIAAKFLFGKQCDSFGDYS